jgi:uncharacterized membrane protein (DUF2068 family)
MNGEETQGATPPWATGIRTAAVFEATKGLLVLIVGFGLLSLAHRDAQHVAEQIVRHFHLDLARDHPRILIEAANHLSNERLRLLAGAALLYSSVRFVEAYGLWRMRTWAEWFAIISGAVYLPAELYELVHAPSVVKAAVLAVNLALVGYLVSVRWRAARHARCTDSRPEE